MTIVGTRPEIIRLSRCIPKFDEFFDHTLVHTGQNYDYELNEIFFEDLELRRPDVYLNAAGSSAAETIGKVIIESDKVLAEYKPEAVVILGDTNSSMAAIAAKKRKIPIFHIEAGNRCFDQRVPEETNRKIVDHIADVNITYSQIAREYLLEESFPRDRVIKLGTPLYEVLMYYRPKINKSRALESLNLKKQEYFLCSFHREENVDNDIRLNTILETMQQVQRVYGLPLIISTHPRTKKRLADQEINGNPQILFSPPFSYTDYIALQENATCILSDSGSITEEASILGLKALNMRDAHERPEGNEKAVVLLTGLTPRVVLDSLAIILCLPEQNNSPVADYLVPDFSAKLLKIVRGYTSYINSYVWRLV
jgi:UDP-N-acetylglucosamine 2-epimerase (non-hydrolysing)